MRTFIKHNIDEAANYNKLAKLTDRNDHNGALLEGAKIIKAKRLANIMKSIIAIHKEEGSMPVELMRYRDSISRRLMHLAKKKLSPEDYTQFHGAF